MIKSKKLQLVMVLVLACLCAPILSAEPNKAETELKFDIRKDRPPARHLMPRSSSRDLYTNYAVLFVRGDWDIYGRDVPIEAMLETSAGQSMSQLQHEIISNQSIRFMDNGSTISDYTYFQLFGVGEDDVQKMVKAFVEILANQVNVNMQNLIKRKNELREKIAGAEKELAEKETQQKDVEESFEEVKKKVHYLSAEEARKTVEELNKTLDELNIEIAGMQRKLSAIDEEHSAARTHMKSREQQEIYKNTIWPKLELMRIDQIIDLRVAEERNRTALKIRREAKEFYHLQEQSLETQKILRALSNRLSNHQESLRNIERRLTTEPGLLSPKVFQNKVTIYPVRVEED